MGSIWDVSLETCLLDDAKNLHRLIVTATWPTHVQRRSKVMACMGAASSILLFVSESVHHHN